MKLNLGVIRIFGLRGFQVTQYLMIVAMFLGWTGAWVKYTILVVASLYLVLDIWKIFPQEQEYGVERNKFLLKEIRNGKEKP